MLLRGMRYANFKDINLVTYSVTRIPNGINKYKNLLPVIFPKINIDQKNYYCKTVSISNDHTPKKADDWETIISQWYKKYQDFVGISSILEAQNKVTELSNDLMNVQLERRYLQKEVEVLNKKLLDTHQLITKSELYSDDHHLLFEKARVLSTSLKSCQENFLIKEDKERDLFTFLSAAIKSCHEKERSQSEQSKYWSILLSVISASIASLITSINNWVRIKEIKEHATHLHDEAVEKIEQLFASVSTQQPDKSMDTKCLEDVKVSIIEEINKIKVTTVPIVNVKPVKEITFANIVTHMTIGAAIGTMITYLMFSLGDS